MDWKTLFSPERLGGPPATDADWNRRGEAQRDLNRIVFSPAFRRLQRKTQIFPLPESDMTHTRLTHSLETSCVGRSLGWLVADRVEALKEWQADAAAIVAAAALAHDIGNPPFGHSGEEAIGHFFATQGERYLEGLDERQRQELLAFEGNALGFRLLTDRKPAHTAKEGGYGLTYATLAAFTKYPCPADRRDKARGVHRKKFGFFHDNLQHFSKAAEVLGMRADGEDAWFRHPLAFLTEAADDICYRVIDLEDGYKLGIIGYEQTVEILTKLAAAGGQSLNSLNEIRAKDQRVSYLRAKAIANLIAQVVDVFVANSGDLLEGQRKKPLLDDVPSLPDLAELEVLSIERIYRHRGVVEIEAAGFEVLGFLLDVFLDAVFAEKKTAKHKKHLMLLPDQYKAFKDEGELPRATQILNVCEYVASMTDAYAINVYRTLRGISLPSSRA